MCATAPRGNRVREMPRARQGGRCGCSLQRAACISRLAAQICHIRHRQQMANVGDKPLVWLKGQVKTPPFSNEARLEAGLLLRRLQQGQGLGLPHSRPMPAIGRQCHELRISDRDQAWRITYHVAPDAIVILHVFSKKTQATPVQIVEVCQKRLAAYLRAISDEENT